MLDQGRRVPLRFTLAPGFHIARLWRSVAKFLGVLMIFAGLGWFTFVKPSFALSLAPYVFLPGIIGEGMLTLWLVLFGVNEHRWKEAGD